MPETIDVLREQGRLIRRAWADTDTQGKQLFCIYTALAGDPEARPNTCPASLAPRWVAYLLPWLDDAGSEDAWPSVVRRVVRLAPHLPRLSAGVEYTCRRIAVEEAMWHVADENAEALAACRAVIVLCRRAEAGDPPSSAEWAAVRAKEEAAAWAAAWAAEEAAARTAARAAEEAAAWAAAWSMEVAEVRTAEAAADRLSDVILSALEADVGIGGDDAA